MADRKKYIMDDPRESGRLETKVNTATWINQYFERISDAGSSTLEVGCGPGTLINAIKKLHPRKHPVGIDSSFARLHDACIKEPACVVQANGQMLPFSEATFDSVFTRFLLEYLADCEQVVNEIYRVCKPGGKVMLQDLDGQLVTNWPVDNSLADKIDKIINTLADSGFDPFVGRKLFTMARTSGLKAIDVSVEPYHLIAGSAAPDQLKQWELKLEIARPLIAEALGNEKEAVLFTNQYLEYLENPNTFTYSNIVTVVGTKPSINR